MEIRRSRAFQLRCFPSFGKLEKILRSFFLKNVSHKILMRENGKKREEKRIYFLSSGHLSIAHWPIENVNPNRVQSQRSVNRRRAPVRSRFETRSKVRVLARETWANNEKAYNGRSMTLKRETRKRSGAREAMSRKRVKSGPATTEALNNRFLINASRGSWSALLGLSLVELKRDCSTTCCSRLKPIAACTWRIQKEILLILLRNVGETCVIL